MHLRYEKLMEFMPSRICALALMPGRICALELMPDRIQSKNETTHIYKYNITFIDKYFIGKRQTRLYNEAEVHSRSKSTGYIKLLQF